jgi:hypothetical protein
LASPWPRQQQPTCPWLRTTTCTHAGSQCAAANVWLLHIRVVHMLGRACTTRRLNAFAQQHHDGTRGYTNCNAFAQQHHDGTRGYTNKCEWLLRVRSSSAVIACDAYCIIVHC